MPAARCTFRRTFQPAVVTAIAGLVACSALGCGDAAEAPQGAESEQHPTAIDPEELARLRALGYAGVAEPLGVTQWWSLLRDLIFRQHLGPL